MPVILPKEAWSAWLDPAAQVRELQPLLAPCPSNLLAAHPVSQAVGNVGNDGPGLILPAV
jgi:putative SOS response-associated peptidase YedK